MCCVIGFYLISNDQFRTKSSWGYLPSLKLDFDPFHFLPQKGQEKFEYKLFFPSAVPS